MQETAWEILTYPGYSLTMDHVTVRGCPFLLGCQQVVRGEQVAVLAAWRESLAAHPPVMAFLQGRGHPLPDWHYVQAVLACTAAALAAHRHHDEAFLEYGSHATQWFSGSPPVLGPVRLPGESPSFLAKHPIGARFAALAEHVDLPTAQARDLTQWLWSPAQSPEPLRTQKMLVPFYHQGTGGAVASLELELRTGRGAFYADPVTMAFVHWDAEFTAAYDTACTYLRALGWWRQDVDICWRVQADPPLFSLQGGSAGGAFFANLWHLSTGTWSDLSVTISAGIRADGRVVPVDHIQEKIQAVLKVPELSQIIVAADQAEVEVTADLYDRPRIWKVGHAANFTRHARLPGFPVSANTT